MIQINLLPELKREYLHSQQTKHSFILASTLTSIIAVGVLVLVFVYVQVLQPQHRHNVQKDIDASIVQLKNKKEAVKIVTVQGALEQLPGLQDKKQLTSRLFNYLKGFTPRGLNYNEVKLDLTANTLSVTGAAQSHEQANVLANNLKSAQLTYTKGDRPQTITPFSAVVFADLSRNDQAANNAPVSFQLTFTVDPVLFDQASDNPVLKVNAASDQLLLPSAKPFSETANQKTPGGAQ